MFDLLRQMLNVSTLSSLFQPAFSIKLILGIIFFVLLYLWSSSHTNPSSRPPPSPPKLPIIGNIHQLGLIPHRSLQALIRRYGPLMLLRFGSKPVLVVSSAEAARQLFQPHDILLSDRPRVTFFKKIFYNHRDMASSPYGEYWRQLRSVCVLNLLSHKSVRSFRSVRQEKTNSLLSSIDQQRSSSSSVVNLSELFLELTHDVIATVSLGTKVSSGENGWRLKQLTRELTVLITNFCIGDYIPWLAWVDRLKGLDAKVDDLAKRIDEFLVMIVQQHMDSLVNGSSDGMDEDDDDQKGNDFIDILLRFQKEDPAGVSVDRVSIKAVLLKNCRGREPLLDQYLTWSKKKAWEDMFVAGTDNTYIVLEWTMSEFLRNPRIMEKLQKEVRGIARSKQDITEDDLEEMHYLKAVIKETLRLHPPTALLFPRLMAQDVKVMGYDIKANTQIMINAWQIGRDPEAYDNPEKFEPERFFNNTGIDYKGHDFQFLPFGTGRRGCPGIHFALVVEEFALANIVHKFNWKLSGGARGEDLDMTECPSTVRYRKYPLQQWRNHVRGCIGCSPTQNL